MTISIVAFETSFVSLHYLIVWLDTLPIELLFQCVHQCITLNNIFLKARKSTTPDCIILLSTVLRECFCKFDNITGPRMVFYLSNQLFIIFLVISIRCTNRFNSSTWRPKEGREGIPVFIYTTVLLRCRLYEWSREAAIDMSICLKNDLMSPLSNIISLLFVDLLCVRCCLWFVCLLPFCMELSGPCYVYSYLTFVLYVCGEWVLVRAVDSKTFWISMYTCDVMSELLWKDLANFQRQNIQVHVSHIYE